MTDGRHIVIYIFGYKSPNDCPINENANSDHNDGRMTIIWNFKSIRWRTDTVILIIVMPPYFNHPILMTFCILHGHLGCKEISWNSKNYKFSTTVDAILVIHFGHIYVHLWDCSICAEFYTLCSEKNTHSQFLSYLHEWCVNLNKNCSEYTQGMVDSNNVEIRYSLRPMT